MPAYDLSTPAPGRRVTGPSSASFWTQPNRNWLVGYDGDWVPSRTLPVPDCARRGSRSGSELPPFGPCTAAVQVVRLLRVGHAVTGSPPGWESHPHGYRVVRGPPAPATDTRSRGSVVSQRIAPGRAPSSHAHAAPARGSGSG